MLQLSVTHVTPETFQRELPLDYSLTPASKEEYNIPVFKFSPEIAYRLFDK